MKTNKLKNLAIFSTVALLALPSIGIYARENNDETRDTSDEEISITANGLTSTERRNDDNDDSTSSNSRRDKEDIEDNNDDENDDNRTTTQNQTSSENREDNEDNSRAEEHRSSVSAFVQNLLNIADNNKGGIGEQVREVAKELDESKDKVSTAIEEIESRSKIKTFFIGTDYKNVGEIRSEIAKTENRIDKLNRLLASLPTSTPSTSTIAEIDNLKAEEVKLNTFVSLHENTFSLFGWFMKLFN
ncbi:MAG: hypothetical protein WC725_04385 [Patescibacteria group bacterium]|jgi:hypothetical protein